MRRVLENQENLDVRQTEVVNILTEESDESGKKKVIGVQTLSGGIYRVKAVVLCTGTYLRARCVYGEVSNATGPNGLQAANHLTDMSEESLELKCTVLKRELRQELIKVLLISVKWKSSMVMRESYHFHLPLDPEDVQIDQVAMLVNLYKRKDT